MGNAVKKTLTIMSSNLIKEGSTNDKPWAIYEIFARDAEGNPIEEKLKAFWQPTDKHIGQALEYDVERQEHEKYGVSFMIHRPEGTGGGTAPGGGGGGGLGASLDMLREEVEALRARVTILEEASHTAPATPTPGSEPPGAAVAEGANNAGLLPPQPTGAGGEAKRQSPAKPSQEFSNDDIPF
jgi:hypothetical protein